VRPWCSAADRRKGGTGTVLHFFADACRLLDCMGLDRGRNTTSHSQPCRDKGHLHTTTCTSDRCRTHHSHHQHGQRLALRLVAQYRRRLRLMGLGQGEIPPVRASQARTRVTSTRPHAHQIAAVPTSRTTSMASDLRCDSWRRTVNVCAS
jgi:hypothetical protein